MTYFDLGLGLVIGFLTLLIFVISYLKTKTMRSNKGAWFSLVSLSVGLYLWYKYGMLLEGYSNQPCGGLCVVNFAMGTLDVFVAFGGFMMFFISKVMHRADRK